MIQVSVTCSDCFEPFETFVEEDDDPDLFDVFTCDACKEIQHDLDMEKRRSEWNFFDYD